MEQFDLKWEWRLEDGVFLLIYNSVYQYEGWKSRIF